MPRNKRLNDDDDDNDALALMSLTKKTRKTYTAVDDAAIIKEKAKYKQKKEEVSQKNDQFKNLLFCANEMTEEFGSSDDSINGLNSSIEINKKHIQESDERIESLSLLVQTQSEQYEQNMKKLLEDKQHYDQQQAALAFSSIDEESGLSKLTSLCEDAQAINTDLQNKLEELQIRLLKAEQQESQYNSRKQENEKLKKSIEKQKTINEGLAANVERLNNTIKLTTNIRFFRSKPASPSELPGATHSSV